MEIEKFREILAEVPNLEPERGANGKDTGALKKNKEFRSRPFLEAHGLEGAMVDALLRAMRERDYKTQFTIADRLMEYHRPKYGRMSPSQMKEEADRETQVDFENTPPPPEEKDKP